MIHFQPCFIATEIVCDGMSSPIGVGIATAESLKRFSEKLTNGVPSAFCSSRLANPVQSTKKSAAIVSPSFVRMEAMSPFSSSCTCSTWQGL